MVAPRRIGRRVRIALALAATVLATLAGSLVVLATYSADRELDVATVRLSVDVGREGTLSLYVPLVDWGVRFDAIRLPARLNVDVRSIDRAAAERIAREQRLDVAELRADARDAIASYLRTLLGLVLVGGLALGTLMALALRGRPGHAGWPRLRWLLAATVLSALAATAAVALLLPPRGALEDPEYFAHGSDIPAALRAVEAATRSADAIGEELDAQLVGLARLVIAPGELASTSEAPRLVLVSDIHNNLLVLPALRRAAQDGPLFIAGDLTDRGSRVETSVTEAFAEAGDPVVFVAGNHDSLQLSRRLAQAGAIVLTERGRLLPGGEYGPVVVRVAGLRVAGYEDPFMRRPGQTSAPDPRPTPLQQAAFDAWLQGIQDEVDVVMVHEPGLARLAFERLERDPPAQPLAFLVGHTHVPSLRTARNVVVLNGGTAGGGGTGNLTENQPIGLAVLSYEHDPRFEPLAADLVEIDPASGDASASRRRLQLGTAETGAGSLFAAPAPAEREAAAAP